MEKATLNITSWWTAFQSDSVLASFDNDCLPHIFTQLSLSDAFHLGFACRRLYFYFEELQKTTKAIEIISGYLPEANKPKHYFRSNINIDARDVNETAKQILFKPRLNFEYDPFPLTIIQKFADAFVNLRYLEMSFFLNLEDFTLLLNQLATSFPLMTTLKLYPYFFENIIRSENVWRSLEQLQHPTLRHLTLYNLSLTFITKSVPHIPILQQLTSFSFGSFMFLFNFYKLIRGFLGLPYASYLTPGVGIRFSIFFNFLSWYEDKTMELELMPYITHLRTEIGNGLSLLFPSNKVLYKGYVESLFSCLLHMHNLQKVDLRIDGKMESSDYPSFLTALSSLTHLRELSVSNIPYLPRKNFKLTWPRSTMPVLPSVTVFCLYYRTANHTDAVEQYHLAHCFPGLQLLKIHFDQYDCEHCGRRYENRSVRLPQYQICGPDLARGVLEMQLPGRFMLKKVIEFTFDQNVHFKSLENLLAGVSTPRERICPFDLAFYWGHPLPPVRSFSP